MAGSICQTEGNLGSCALEREPRTCRSGFWAEEDDGRTGDSPYIPTSSIGRAKWPVAFLQVRMARSADVDGEKVATLTCSCHLS